MPRASLRKATLLLCVVLVATLAGCIRKRPQPVTPLPTPLQTMQQVIEHGNFASYLADNRARLKSCWRQPGCDEPLFHLCFLHTYAHSPYYDPPTALQYLDELIETYPDSQWAAQARIWRPLIQENVALAERQRNLEQTQRSLEERLRTETCHGTRITKPA